MQKKLFQLFVCAVIVLRIPGKNKNRGQTPSVSCFIARYAKNYFFRTTSPPRPVCAVMYSRPILAYSNGLALAGSALPLP